MKQCEEAIFHISVTAIVFLIAGCTPTKYVSAPRYQIYLYYKNSKGEDLLDPLTDGHYNNGDIKINGNGEGVGDFTIGTMQPTTSFPKGYSLSFVPSNGGSSPGVDLITLNKTTTDTLTNQYSGYILISSKYNSKEELPANFSVNVFAVTILK